MIVDELSLRGNMRPSASVCTNTRHPVRSLRRACDEGDGVVDTPAHLQLHAPLFKPPGSVSGPMGAEKSAPQLLVAARILFGQELQTESKSGESAHACPYGHVRSAPLSALHKRHSQFFSAVTDQWLEVEARGDVTAPPP